MAGPGRASTVYPLIREQAFLVKGPSEAKKLHLSHSLPRGASARASAMEAPPPADVAEEVLASLASPGMAGHLRGVLRAEDAHAPYGALDLDAPPHGALDLDASSDESDEALMLAALAGAIARGDGRARPSRRPRPRPRPGSAADPAPFDPYATADSPPSRPLRVRVPRPGSHHDARARRARASLRASLAAHPGASFTRAPRFAHDARDRARAAVERAALAAGAPAWLARDAATRLDGPPLVAPPDPNATRPDAAAGAPRWRRREDTVRNVRKRSNRVSRSKTLDAASSSLASLRATLGLPADLDAREWDATEASSDVVKALAATRKKAPAASFPKNPRLIREAEAEAHRAKRPSTARVERRGRGLRAGDDSGGVGDDSKTRTRSPEKAANDEGEGEDADAASSSSSSDDAWWTRPFGETRARRRDASLRAVSDGRGASGSAPEGFERLREEVRPKPRGFGRGFGFGVSRAKSLFSGRDPGPDMLSPDTLRAALERTRGSRVGARGVTRWARPSVRDEANARGSKKPKPNSKPRRGTKPAARTKPAALRSVPAPLTPSSRVPTLDARTNADPTRPRTDVSVAAWPAPPAPEPPAPSPSRRAPSDRRAEKEDSFSDDENENVLPDPSGAFEASARRSSAFTFAKAPRDRAAARSSGEAPGPGAYDPAAAEPATRPSAPAASFEPRAPAEIRKPPATPQKEAEAEEEEPRSRTPFGGSTTGKSGAHVRFALAPERVTVAAEVWNAAAEANARATSAELIAAKEAREALEKRRRLRRRDGSNPADEGGDDKTVTTKLSPPTTKKKPPPRPLDALAAAIAAGRIVAPPEPSRALAERRVVGGAWGRADKTVQDSNGSTAAGTRDHPFSAVKDAYDSASDPFASWSRSVGRRVAASAFGSLTAPTGRAADPNRFAESVRWNLDGATHAPADELARGRALGGGVLPLDAYLGRFEDYESRRRRREEAERARRVGAGRGGEREKDLPDGRAGVGSPDPSGSYLDRIAGTYKVVEALDYLRRATPSTIFALAADRWRRGGRRRRVDARRFESATASRAAEALDAADDDAAAREDDEGPAWLTREALEAAERATRPSPPTWSFLPVEVTRRAPGARGGAGGVAEPGNRPELDVTLTLVRRNPPGALPFETGEGASSRRFKDESGEGATGPGVGPGSYRPDASSAAPRAPATTFAKASTGRDPGGVGGGDTRGDTDVTVRDGSKDVSKGVSTKKEDRGGDDQGKDDRTDAARARAFASAPRLGRSAAVDFARAPARFPAAAADDGEVVAEEGSLRPPLSSPSSPPRRPRVAGHVDFARMTWRVAETSEGKVALDLVEAAVGPGTYDPGVDAVSGFARAPAFDFGRAAVRFPPEEDDTEGTRVDANEAVRRSLDVVRAANAARPRVDVGGVDFEKEARRTRSRRGRRDGDATLPMDPRASVEFIRDSEDAVYDLALDAVYDVERSLAFLRSNARSAAPDFAAAPGREDDRVSPEAERYNTSDAGANTSVAADASRLASGDAALDASLVAASAGVRGSLRARAHVGARSDVGSRFPPARREVSDGDVLYLVPESADAFVFPTANEKTLVDIERRAGRAGRVPGIDPTGESSLTRDVAYLSLGAVSKSLARLDAGGASAAPAAVRNLPASFADDTGTAENPHVAPGAYESAANARFDAGAEPGRTGRGRVRGAETMRSTSGAGANPGIRETLPRLPEALEGDVATLGDARESGGFIRSRAMKAESKTAPPMARARARWDGADGVGSVSSASVADSRGGDVALGGDFDFSKAEKSGKKSSSARGTDFARGAGRGDDPARAWGKERVVHALRAEIGGEAASGGDPRRPGGPPRLTTLDRTGALGEKEQKKGGSASAGFSETASARRVEREDRRRARGTTRGAGEAAPGKDGAGRRRSGIV